MVEFLLLTTEFAFANLNKKVFIGLAKKFIFFFFHKVALEELSCL